MNLSKNYDYIYLHGFASTPDSGKAQYFKAKFFDIGISLYLPDLNQNDFSNLTITRQLEQVQKLIKKSSKPIILIGSSMGGIASVILAENNSNIKKLILLAPAFKISQLWRDGISVSQLEEWKIQGTSEVFHYGYEKKVQLNYQFYLDLFNHNDSNFSRAVPTLIFHGINDDVVPINLSQEYTQQNPNSTLISLEDDHSLKKDLNYLWNKSIQFINS